MVKTCLIAEADPFIARLLERFAEESGLQPLHARVGQDALELIRNTHPTVIILEPELPGKIRGWDIVHALKADAENYAIPLIACSWLQENEIQTLIGEVQGSLKKPDLHYENFVAALKSAGIEIGCEPASAEENQWIEAAAKKSNHF
jgi:DNA-binding response OmpR family regulator